MHLPRPRRTRRPERTGRAPRARGRRLWTRRDGEAERERGREGRRRRSLAGQLFLMQIAVVAAVLVGCAVAAYTYAQGDADESARRQVVAEALAIAQTPTVREAVLRPDPTAVLQPYAESVRHDTGVSFITIMSPGGVRYTHPDPGQIGRHFLGDRAQALAGHTFTETYRGTLGRSVRVVTPVRDVHGKVSALVSVGITVQAIDSRLRGQLLALLGIALGALAVTGTGTYLVGSRLRRHTHGMGAEELGRMYDHHQATLHAVREGLLLLDAPADDAGLRIALCNDAARELLGLPPGAEGRRLDELGLPEPLVTALRAPEPQIDQVHLTAERVVAVNTRPVRSGSRRGTVVTLRDHTELQALTGELDTVRGFAEALRSQAHEASNRLHTVVSLIGLGRPQEAVEFATAELELAQALTDQVMTAVSEPVLAALLLGKAAQANERGVELELTPDSRVDDGMLPPALPARDLVTVLGNLVDNAIDAAIDGAAGSPVAPRVSVTARVTDDHQLLLRVRDTGPGIDPDAVREVFRRGWTTKAARTDDDQSVSDGIRPHGQGLGLALVAQAVRRNGGAVELGGDGGSADGGAVFTVLLPLEEPHAPAGEKAREKARAR